MSKNKNGKSDRREDARETGTPCDDSCQIISSCEACGRCLHDGKARNELCSDCSPTEED
jgi:hypothetical protein